MSHPSPPGERSSATSPRSLYAGSTLNPASSRPGTASTTKVESHAGSVTTASVSTSDAAPGQHEYRKRSPEPPVQTSSRAFGFQSILNPSSDNIQSGSQSTTLPPLGHINVGHSLLPAPSASPRSRKRLEPTSPRLQQEPSHNANTGRRVLTPKSPGLRAASLGTRRSATFHGTGVSLQPLSTPEPRVYTAEPGHADIPALPPLAVATRAPLPSVSAVDYSSFSSRQANAPSSHPHGLLTPTSRQGDTPHTSQASKNQQDQTSPRFRYDTSAPPPQQTPSAFRVLSAGGNSGYSLESYSHGPHEGYQSGPASYQMTLDTDQGPMVVPVELDLQQASKVADEKRKRNAGASARFRARRKEKEKEASHMISGLQQELREMAEERDFYRTERNVFRDLVARHIGAAQMPPRPPSPHTQRRSARSTSITDASRSVEEGYRARSNSASTQRRRTGDYQPSFMHGAQSPSVQSYTSSYSIAPPMPLAPPPRTSGPYASPRSLPPGPPGPPPQVNRSSSYDPFRNDPFDRSWNPGR